MADPRTALITGASSGIGEATARALAGAGFEVVVAARRVERLERLAKEIGGRAIALDVTDPDSVAKLPDELPEISVVVHSAGGAHGLEPMAEADEDRWRLMWETNVAGVMRVTKVLLPALERSGDGFVVILGSTAGIDVYEGGGGYTAAKHAVHAIAETLRLELLGKPVRISLVAPGLVETEFSLVRFEGDADRAAEVYRGLEPLTANDVAEVIAFVVTRPPHVDIDFLTIKPTAQATARDTHREA